MTLLQTKWCRHCSKDTHDSEECWSTHAIPSLTVPLHELIGLRARTEPPFVHAPAIGVWLDGSSVNSVAQRSVMS